MTTPSDKKMIEAAKAIYQDNRAVEVDDNAKVSRDDANPDHGAYVAAWVWVDDEDVDDL